jgi:hypothetical protein
MKDLLLFPSQLKDTSMKKTLKQILDDMLPRSKFTPGQVVNVFATEISSPVYLGLFKKPITKLFIWGKNV